MTSDDPKGWCHHCGAPLYWRGKKWCDGRCGYAGKDSYPYVCALCGSEGLGRKGRKFCSSECRSEARSSPLSRAVRSEDWETILVEVGKRARVEGDCHIWPSVNGSGYPTTGQLRGGPARLVHRLVVEAHAGRPLGKMQVHHTCSTRACVRREHLQLVTQAANLVEMRERIVYRERIKQLEAALRDVRPGHPTLRKFLDLDDAK